MNFIREQDIQEKSDIFERLGTRISELEKKEAATSAALPLMFELAAARARKIYLKLLVLFKLKVWL